MNRIQKINDTLLRECLAERMEVLLEEQASSPQPVAEARA